MGLAATAELANTPAAASLISGTSTNPLDDLVSIFGNTGFSGSGPASNPASGVPGGGMNGLAGLNFGGMTSPPPQQSQSPIGGFEMMSPTALNGGDAPVLTQQSSTPSAPKQQQQPQEDLLGLF